MLSLNLKQLLENSTAHQRSLEGVIKNIKEIPPEKWLRENYADSVRVVYSAGFSDYEIEVSSSRGDYRILDEDEISIVFSIRIRHNHNQIGHSDDLALTFPIYQYLESNVRDKCKQREGRGLVALHDA